MYSGKELHLRCLYGRREGCRAGSGGERHSPMVLNILVDHSGNHHGDDGIIPGGDEHERHTDAHAHKGECPARKAGERDSGYFATLFIYHLYIWTDVHHSITTEQPQGS